METDSRARTEHHDHKTPGSTKHLKSLVLGYADTTASIALGTVSDFGSDQVQAQLSATQLDGTLKTYEGTYTVENGVIVKRANVA